MQNFIETTSFDWDLLNDCHDSILVQAPDEEIITCATTVKSFIEQDLVSKGTHFKMKSEVGIGRNWGPQSETNPDGLKEHKF